jgi:hypothetical protein
MILKAVRGKENVQVLPLRYVYRGSGGITFLISTLNGHLNETMLIVFYETQ